MKLTREDLWRIPVVFILSIAGAYACALAYVAVLYWSLPPKDKAYGQGLSQTLRDPFVWNTAAWFATAAGLAVFVPAFLAVRGRNLTVCFAVALACVIAEIAVVTPFGGPIGMLGAFPALAGALVLCRRSKARIFQTRIA
jgi:hypothetical protein